MNIYKGYYSILQFCPEPARHEVANIGVALLCPEQSFFRARIGSGNQRVTHFFDKSQYDIVRLNAYKQGLVDRLNRNSEVTDRESFAQFAAMQVNTIVMTPPQFCRVEGNAEETLENLFKELVGDSTKTKSEGGLRKRLRNAFESSGLLGTIVREDVQVMIPAFDREAKFPFAWQNGVLNLIEPVRFKSADQVSLEQTACRRAIEGMSLQRQEDKKLGRCALNVVGQFQSKDENAKRIVRRILSESKVELIESGSIDAYIQKIKTTGKKFTA